MCDTLNNADLQFEKLAVIIQTKSGKCFQVALTQEHCNVLFDELKHMYFKGNKVKILPDELESIKLV